MSVAARAPSSAARVLKVDITSDTLCPFCYLGLKQFQNAVKSFNEHHPDAPVDAQIRLLPYQLNADLPTQPQLRSDLYAKKFGKERSVQLGEMMAERFRKMGLTPPPPQAESSSSHMGMRLLAYTADHRPEVQVALGEDLLNAYHSQGVHPSDIDKLASIAVDNGVFPDKEAAANWLKGDDLEQEVQKGYLAARRMGVTGVPFFVFQNKWATSGAIGEEEFETLLEEMLKKETA